MSQTLVRPREMPCGPRPTTRNILTIMVSCRALPFRVVMDSSLYLYMCWINWTNTKTFPLCALTQLTHTFTHPHKLGAQLYSTLLKYVPPSPPEKYRPHSRYSVDCRRLSTIQRSPCPSPTPLFQHLYLAVAHWERCMSDSPDFIKDFFNLSHKDDAATAATDDKALRKRSNSMDSFSETKRDAARATFSFSKKFQKNRRQSTPAAITSSKLVAPPASSAVTNRLKCKN